MSKGDSPLRGEMSRSDRGARARRAGRVSGLGDSDGPYVTTRQLQRGGLPPSLAPLVHNDSRQSVGAGHARPAALLCCPSTGWSLPACFAATSPDGEALPAGFARANGSLFQQFAGRGLDPPYKCYCLLPGWLFRFLIITSKYTPYTAIAAALTQADTFNPGVW